MHLLVTIFIIIKDIHLKVADIMLRKFLQNPLLALNTGPFPAFYQRTQHNILRNITPVWCKLVFIWQKR